jgi:hypothetical protein
LAEDRVNCAAIILIPITELWLWATVGAVGGLILFYRGFHILKRKRLILNTPTSKIRSASLGLVEVSGLAVGPYVIQAPVTSKACYYYRTIAWELQKSGKNQEWKKVADESLHVPFYLDDGTGQLMVNPQGAETDLHRDFHEEYSNSFFATEDMPQAVRGFLLRYGVSGEHKVRIEEYCVKPKNALFILGTLSENPGVEAGPKPVPTQAASIASLKVNLAGKKTKIDVAMEPTPATLIPSIKLKTETEQEIINLSPRKQPLTAAEMTQQGKIAAALLKAGISNPAAWSAAGIEDPAAAMAIASGSQASVASSVGTSASPAPATEPFDLRPKVILLKGENNPAFFISWRSQREIVNSLGWKAIAYIWGGPALTLISVYILLAHLEWL